MTYFVFKKRTSLVYIFSLMHGWRLSWFDTGVRKEKNNQKWCTWTRGDWPLLLGFVFAEQFLQASVLEALRMGCRSSYCDHIIEGICGGNSKHPSTGLANRKQAQGARFTSIFHLVLCASCCFENTSSWRTVIHIINRAHRGTTRCLDEFKHVMCFKNGKRLRLQYTVEYHHWHELDNSIRFNFIRKLAFYCQISS